VSAALEVLEAGLQASVQDLGRPGFLALGVSRSGALDRASLRLANRLVGNTDGTAALEIRSPAPVLRALARVRMALCGTSAGLIVEATGGAVHWPSWRTVDVEAGQIVRVPPFGDSGAAYLSLSGGIDVPEVLGSRSTSVSGGFGGHEGRPLADGDRLHLFSARFGPHHTLLQPPGYPETLVLRVMRGPQDDRFTADALRLFLSQPFTVTRDISRMGARLSGEKLVHDGGAGIISDGVVPGTIQVPASGEPILLLADCQTTGGYAKIATVISADLPLAGRIKPGMEMRFIAVGAKEAAAAFYEAEEAVDRAAAGIVPLREPARL
jgi:biotin-dependent carboxylase-like uncharacterized protein